MLIQAILTLCDIQLLTGLGILVSGYMNLFQNAISTYHWKLLVYLVWFSNLTHVCCLTVIRGYLKQHRWERIWRVILMFVLWAGLLSAFVPTLSIDWSKNDPLRLGATNARCFFDRRLSRDIILSRICTLQGNRPESNTTFEECLKHESIPDNDTIHDTDKSLAALISMVLVFITFFMRLLKITHSCSDRIKTIFRTTPRKWLMRRITKTLNNNSENYGIIRRDQKLLLFQITLYYGLKIHFDFLSSGFVEVSLQSSICSLMVSMLTFMMMCRSSL